MDLTKLLENLIRWEQVFSVDVMESFKKFNDLEKERSMGKFLQTLISWDKECSIEAREKFQKFIHDCCQEYKLRPFKLKEDQAVFKFRMPSGRKQLLFVTRFGKTFASPSFVIAKDLHEMPHYLSSLLMWENDKRKLGFWSIVRIPDGLTYCCKHNMRLDSLNINKFYEIFFEVITSCDWLEGRLLPEL